FIISDGSTNRPIINADDLRNYNLRQSEFEEVKVLGDISLKYPSLRRIYAGVLSKTVVVIPASYSIVRTVHGLSAICRSALDSGGASGCEFEFAFSLAPDVSMIDLFQ